MKLNFTYGKWQSIILLVFILGFSNQGNAATFWVRSGATATNSNNADWTLLSTWTTTSSSSTIQATGLPTSSDTVIIQAGKYVSIPLGGTATCGSLSVLGSSFLNIQATAKLNCTSINVYTAGRIVFITAGEVTSEIVCSGIITLGNISSLGQLTMVASAKVTCSKLAVLSVANGTSSATSLINGRNTLSTFEFTGFGTDVIPIIPAITATANAETDPIFLYNFSVVILNPGTGNTITIPTNFSAQSINIKSGTTNLVENWSSTYNPNGTDDGLSFINIADGAKLQIGGVKKLPKFQSYDFKPNSTIEYNGSQQNITNSPVGYRNLILSGSGRKILEASTSILVSLTINNNVILDLNSKNLTLNSRFNYIGSGCIKSTSASNISYAGDANTSIKFDQTTPGTTNVVKNLTIGGTSYLPSIESPLNVTIDSPLNIKGTLIFNAGHLVANGNVTFKSDAATTAFIGPITDLTYCGIIGDVTVERFIPAGSNNDGINLGRAYRGLSSSVTGGTIFSNWQENGTVATLTGSILGNTLTTTDPSTPLAVGQHISGNLIPANTLITNIDNAASNEYEISTIQNIASVENPASLFARVSITNPSIAARFTGFVFENLLTVSAFTVGTTLTVGQKITGSSLLPNTVITIDNGDGTYVIGLEIPSQEIHYNGAPAGFGTHITGIVGTDAQLGQNDYNSSTDTGTGLDYTRSGNPSLYTYSNGSQVFGQVMSTKATNLVAGTPYLIAIRGDRTIDLALNNTPPTNTILRSTGAIVEGIIPVSDLNSTLDSFNFVGNPYQAPVDLSLIFTDPARWSDLGTSYTVFDSKMNTRGAYVTFDFAPETYGSTNPDSAMDNTLEPNQAFFVSTKGSSPTLVFNETDKDITNTGIGNAYIAMFRTRQNTTPIIKGSICNATTNKALDGFVIAFGDSYSNTIVAEDTKKPSGNQDETIASLNDANKMAIDKRNFPSEADEIPLSITQYRLTNYVMKFNVSNFDQMDAYLVDTYTATETTLNNNEINSYPFTVDTSIPASIAENRFKIVFRNSALSTNSNSISAFAVYPNPVVDNKFTIKSNQAFSGKDANVTILNAIGQKVYSTNGIFSTDGSLLVNPTVALSKGIYLVKVAVEGKVEAKKLIIK